MQMLNNDAQRSERGFTLVELAIVLVIVGLLIGGVLKGQALIDTARITTAVTQAKSLDTAAYTFQDSFGGLAGDLLNAQSRIPNCSNATHCSEGTATAGNNQIDNTPAVAMGGNEGSNFFLHLSLASLIESVGIPSGNNAAGNGIGTGLMGSKIGNGISYRIGYASTSANLAASDTTNFEVGHYLAIAGADDSTIAAGTGTTLTPAQASRFDIKFDDGLPNTGSVRGAGTLSAAGCAQGTGVSAANNFYNTTLTTPLCALYVRVLQ